MYAIRSYYAEQLVQSYRNALEKGACVVKEWQPMSQQYQMNWTPFLGHDWDIQYDSRNNFV